MTGDKHSEKKKAADSDPDTRTRDGDYFPLSTDDPRIYSDEFRNLMADPDVASQLTSAILASEDLETLLTEGPTPENLARLSAGILAIKRKTD
jgi:hypothetical protein